MSKSKLFTFFFLLLTVGVFGQSDLTQGVVDQVTVKFDQKKGKLTAERNYKQIFYLKEQKDSTWNLNEKADSLSEFVNRHAGNVAKYADSFIIKKIKDSASFTFPFNVNNEVQESTCQVIAHGILEKERDEFKSKYVVSFGGVGVLLLLLIGVLIWAFIENKKKRSLQKKSDQSLKSELTSLLEKHFENAHLDIQKNDADQMIAQLAATQKKLTDEKNDWIKKEKQLGQSLSEKNVEIDDYLQKISEHDEAIRKIQTDFKSKEAVERERINALCIRMIERKDRFINGLRNLEVEVAKKEMLRFSLAYVEMAISVLDEIRGKNSESGKLNIRLLNGSKEKYGKIFDEQTPEELVDKELILMAKLLSDYGIESVDDVYFNGDKYQQRN